MSVCCSRHVILLVAHNLYHPCNWGNGEICRADAYDDDDDDDDDDGDDDHGFSRP